jgi:hypothetical protein
VVQAATLARRKSTTGLPDEGPDPYSLSYWNHEARSLILLYTWTESQGPLSSLPLLINQLFYEAGLYGLGIPKDSILRYETALKTAKFVLIVHGSMDDTTHAKEILNRTKPETLEHHQ